MKRPGLFALVLLLAACGDGGKRVPVADTFDLRPRWPTGMGLTFREERETRAGNGPFPPEGEILARTSTVTRERRIYRLTVEEGQGAGLYGARFDYLTSIQGPEFAPAPDLLAGRSFRVMDPLGKFEAREGGEGPQQPVTKEEKALLLSTALRMAASLLPAEPVPLQATWKPGRDLDVFVRQGRGPIRMVPRLEEIQERDGKRFARVTCDTEASVLEGAIAGTRVSMRETLFMDLGAGAIAGYSAVTEWRLPAGPSRGEEWRRITVDLAVEP